MFFLDTQVIYSTTVPILIIPVVRYKQILLCIFKITKADCTKYVVNSV